MNLAPFGAAAVVLVAWNVAGPLAPIQRLTFRSTTAIVTVDVSVKRGRVPVAGLTAADFILTDNGVAQSIESLSLEAVPIDITLVIDLSNSVIDDLDAFKSDVQRFVKMLRPIDRVRVVSFASAVRENAPMQPASQPIDLRQLEAGGATSLNDGLLLAMLWPGELGRRHLVIAFTDGHDSMSTLANDVLPDLAERVDMVLHAVLVEWQGNVTSWMAGSRAALEEAVRRTGGATHRQSSAAGDFKKIFDDFRASYVLQYMPRGVKREGWHEIAVKINRPDASRYTVRARRGYMASDR